MEEKLKKPTTHSFCETPEEKCTMNFCDENGCQNRKRELAEPKEERKYVQLKDPNTCEHYIKEVGCIKDICSCYTLAKDEIEAAALVLYPISEFPIGSGDTSRLFDENYRDRKLFIEGAKCQAKRMYSEEDLLGAFEAGMMFIGEDKGSFKEWFERFKKK